MRGLGVTCRMVTGMLGLTELHAEGLEGAGGHQEDIHLRSWPGLVLRPPEPPSQPEEISGLENRKAEAGKSGCCGPCSPAPDLKNLGVTPLCYPWTPDLGHGQRLQAGLAPRARVPGLEPTQPHSPYGVRWGQPCAWRMGNEGPFACSVPSRGRL